jgi:N-acetylglucosamine-6-phosphate deacetylase
VGIEKVGLAQAAELHRAAASLPGLLGVHLEGPVIDPHHRGAHAEDMLRSPAVLDAQRVVAAGGVVQVTLAPELPGALELIDEFVRAGVTVAVGHTGADDVQARAAFDAGASLLTHAFNAMPPLHHRSPGPVGAAVADSRVVLEVIADGRHLHPDVVMLLFRSAPGRVALVSDAMAAAGAADGAYRLGNLDVEVHSGVARLAGTDTIAGSTLTLDRAVRNVTRWAVPLTDAVAATTVTPADAIGRSDLGRLIAGARGDAVLWDAALEPRAVWRDGGRLS